jgi:hypothetical protein
MAVALCMQFSQHVLNYILSCHSTMQPSCPQISTELQAYAKEHGLNGETEARSVGMEEMSEQFRSTGAEVYMVSVTRSRLPSNPLVTLSYICSSSEPRLYN